MANISQQVFHLKEAPAPKPGGLDFEVAENEDFSPNKLRAQFERLYMGVVGLPPISQPMVTDWHLVSSLEPLRLSNIFPDCDPGGNHAGREVFS